MLKTPLLTSDHLNFSSLSVPTLPDVGFSIGYQKDGANSQSETALERGT